MYYNNINPTYTSSNLRSSLATNYKKNYSGRLDNFSAKKSDEDMINRRKKSEIPTRSYTIDRTLDRTDQSFNPSSIITQQLDLSPFSYSQVNRNSVNSPRTELNRSQKSSSVYPSNNNVSYGRYFLPEKSRSNLNKKTLILDLDETLVHSQFKPFYFKSDIVLNVTFERQGHVVHVMKRPYVDEFIEKMANLYELVIFTASISAYANPLIDRLDPRRLISHRLFREHCVSTSGSFIKDLKKLGRDLRDVIILDNNPVSYAVNRENGVPIVTWHHDKSDMELYKMIPVFEFLANVQDVRDYISKFVVGNSVNYQMANSIMKSNSKNDRDSYKPVVIGRNENYKFDNSLTKPQNINIKIINHNISNVYVKEELKENKKRDYKDTNLFRSPKRLYDDSPLDQDSYLNQSKKEIISHNGKYSSLANSNYIGKPSVLGEIKLNNYYDDNEDDLSKGNKYTSSLGSYNSRKYTTELPRKVYDPLVNDDYLKEYKTPSNFSLTSNFNTRDYLSGENKQNKDTINSRPSRPGTSNGLRNSFNLSEINNLISSITPKRVTSNSVHSRTIYETNKVKRNNFNENENKRISSSKTVDRTRDTKYSTYDRNEMINYTSLDRKGSCKNCFNSLDLQNSRLSSNGRLNSTQFSTTLSGGSFLNKFRAPESNYVSNTNTQKFSQSMRDRFYPLGSSVLYK